MIISDHNVLLMYLVRFCDKGSEIFMQKIRKIETFDH